MDRQHTCCVTGHRDIPVDKKVMVCEGLREEVERVLAMGYTHFISGFAAGADLLFAEIVAELKKSYAITLEAAIPYRNRLYTRDEYFQRLIEQCDVGTVLVERYFKGCYMLRNRYMVDQSSLVLAVYDGRSTGGTATTVRYAQKKECVVQTVSPY